MKLEELKVYQISMEIGENDYPDQRVILNEVKDLKDYSNYEKMLLHLYNYQP